MRIDAWHILGGAAQLAFASRFVVQWIVSESRGQSVIPTYFWYASIAGSLGLLAYALHIRDPIFTLGQAFGFVVYIRNLRLLRRADSA